MGKWIVELCRGYWPVRKNGNTVLVQGPQAATDTPSGQVFCTKCTRNLRHAMPEGKLYIHSCTNVNGFFFPSYPVRDHWRLIEFLNKICVRACESFEFFFSVLPMKHATDSRRQNVNDSSIAVVFPEGQEKHLPPCENWT